MAKRTSTEQEIDIIKRYEAGESASFLAQELGLDKGTVYRVLKRSGTQLNYKWTLRTPEQEAQMIERYVNGENANAIAVSFGIPADTVRNVLKRNSVEIRPSNYVELSDEQRTVVASLCSSGTSIGKVSEQFDISTQTVGRILREYGISMPKGRRTHTLNYTAFDVLTPESEYWMGFLFADGSLPKNNSGQQPLAINLSARDVKQLEKLRDFLGSTHKISYKERPEEPFILVDGHEIYTGPVVSYRVRSNQIADALRRRGMYGKSSGERVPIDELVNSRDFWRGCIDGDGSLGIQKIGNYLYPQISLCGHIPILEKYRIFLRSIGITTLHTNKTRSGIFRVGTGCTNATTILEALYGNVTLALDRKLHDARALLCGDFASVRGTRIQNKYNGKN